MSEERDYALGQAHGKLYAEREDCREALGSALAEMTRLQESCGKLKAAYQALEAKIAGMSEALNKKRQQLQEYIAGIDEPMLDESRYHALTFAKGRLAQIDMDIALLSNPEAARRMVAVVEAAEPFTRWHEVLDKASCLRRIEEAYTAYRSTR